MPLTDVACFAASEGPYLHCSGAKQLKRNTDPAKFSRKNWTSFRKTSLKIFEVLHIPSQIGHIDCLSNWPKGLTPSGDDLLVAYRAMFYAFKRPTSGEVSNCLAAPLSTTDVSKAYISTSIKGYVKFIDLSIID